ncbi:tetratricopeptide repeat protein [Rickettsiales bacterium]|nr:tetratricopeptide repeat protein [Rickettsiales bacterium]
MSDLYEEIKEDIASERYAKIWNKYGNMFIGFAVLIVMATALGVYWNNSRVKSVTSAGDDLYEASIAARKDNFSKAEEIYNKIIKKNVNKGTVAVAKLQNAAQLYKEGKKQEAAQQYLDISQDDSIGQEIRHLGSLLYLYASADQGKIESLEDKISKKDNPWYYSALEFEAFYLLSNDKKNQAKEKFEELIVSMDAPKTIRTRASEMLRVLSQKEVLQ